MTNLTIVIAEPNLRAARAIARDLSDDGTIVQVCGTRSEASVALRQRPIDMLFTELQLPDGEGLGLIIEAQAQRPSVTCVVIASRVSAEQVAEAWRLGACDIVFKPITRHGLLAAFQRAVRTRRSSANTVEPILHAQTEAPSATPHDERDLPLTISLTGDFVAVQRHLAHAVIRRFDGNKSAAARALGLHRRTLYRLIAE